jgi:ABC-type microcin C transport system permease subunit YejE
MHARRHDFRDMRHAPQKSTMTVKKALKDASGATTRPCATVAGDAAGRRNVMLAMSVLLMVVVGLWIGAALIGLVFKLVFTLIGGLFSAVGALLGIFFGGVALLIAAPIVALALLPVCLPVIVLAAVVWAIVRMARGPSPQPVAVNAR